MWLELRVTRAQYLDRSRGATENTVDIDDDDAWEATEKADRRTASPSAPTFAATPFEGGTVLTGASMSPAMPRNSAPPMPATATTTGARRFASSRATSGNSRRRPHRRSIVPDGRTRQVAGTRPLPPAARSLTLAGAPRCPRWTWPAAYHMRRAPESAFIAVPPRLGRRALRARRRSSTSASAATGACCRGAVRPTRPLRRAEEE